jgi:hypothetical protein
VMTLASTEQPLPADTEGAPRLIHGAVGDGDRERGEPRRARRLTRADRRRVGRGPASDRARSARRHPAAAGVAHLGVRMAEATETSEVAKAELARTARGLGGVLDELREISRGIRPTSLSQGVLRGRSECWRAVRRCR